MSDSKFLTGRLLLAMPGMFDPRFDRSVNLMCVHDDNGALGIGIGHVRDGIRFRGLLKEVGIDPRDAPDVEVHHGGPVEPGRGFVLHSPDWSGADSIAFSPFCTLSASMEILRAIAAGKGPEKWLIALGYAGWGPGQLENELKAHGWFAAGGHEDVVFNTPAEGRWASTWRAEGIDTALLASETGHA